MKAKAYFPVIGFFKIVALMALILGIGFGIDGHADDTVEQALKNLAVALQADPNLAPETKAALSEVIQALESEREAAPSKQNVPQPPPAEQQSRFDKFSFYGDLRLRHESSLHQDTTPDRHRERLRFRIGTKIEVSPELTIGARLVTGNPDDPKSTHQTLGDDYDSFEVSFDRVYLNYIPDWSKNSWATVGKFGDPFTRNPIFDGLVWDSDVQPEGLAVGHTFDSIAGLDHIRLVLGQYILKERGLEDDAYVSVGQVSTSKVFNDRFTGHAAIGYYSYSDADLSDELVNNRGNALVDTDGDGIPDAYVSNFGILNPIASLSYTGWKKPVTLSGEYLHNLRADISEDSGWAVGIAVGNTKNKGDWKAYYQWQQIEQDAVFSLVSQDDFLSTTNFSGHVAGTKYQITDAMQLHLWAMMSERDNPDSAAGQTRQSQWRLRADLNIQF